MAENQKQVGFIDEIRSWSTQYRTIVERGQDLSQRWGALYQSIVTEDDMPDQIIPSGDPSTRLNSVVSVIGNIDTIVSDFDAGIDTNVERVSG